jgi:excisionase family DNA binding protein
MIGLHPPVTFDDYATYAQVAVQCNCSVETVRRAVQSGLLRSRMVGQRLVLVPVEDVPLLVAQLDRTHKHGNRY